MENSKPSLFQSEINSSEYLFYILKDTRDDLKKLDEKIDANYKHLDSKIGSNFLWTLAALGALMAVMAHGFHWI